MPKSLLERMSEAQRQSAPMSNDAELRARAKEFAGYMRGFASLFRAFPNDPMWGRDDQAEFAAKQMETVRELLLAFAASEPSHDGTYIRA